MVTFARFVRDWVRGFASDAGQDVFEYVLIIGILTVAVLIAVATPVGTNLINAVVDGTCAALDALLPSIDCSAI